MARGSGEQFVLGNLLVGDGDVSSTRAGVGQAEEVKRQQRSRSRRAR